jgi:hypothetical protein
MPDGYFLQALEHVSGSLHRLGLALLSDAEAAVQRREDWIDSEAFAENADASCM